MKLIVADRSCGLFWRACCQSLLSFSRVLNILCCRTCRLRQSTSGSYGWKRLSSGSFSTAWHFRRGNGQLEWNHQLSRLFQQTPSCGLHLAAKTGRHRQVWQKHFYITLRGKNYVSVSEACQLVIWLSYIILYGLLKFQGSGMHLVFMNNLYVHMSGAD